MPDLVIPGGRSKGTPIAQAAADDCAFWGNRCRNDAQSGDPKYKARNLAIADACDARLAQLSGQPAPARAGSAGKARQAVGSAPRAGARAAVAQDTAALAVRSPEQLAALSGSYREPSAVLRMLREAAEVGHLISSQTSAGELPVGCAVSTSIVWIDVEKETYNTDGGKLGLSKTALNRIAAAAGLRWELSHRVDDGSDPHYCSWKVQATRRGFDGSPDTLVSHCSMDLREGSAKIEGKSPKQLAQLRAFIQEHAETKAKNRLIRELGVATGYYPSDLDKPFVVTKLIFTGRSENPRIEEMFAAKMFDAFHGSRQQLYPSSPQLPAPSVGLPPPPLSASYDDDDEPHVVPAYTQHFEPQTHDYRQDGADDQLWDDGTEDDAVYEDEPQAAAPAVQHTIPASPPPAAAPQSQRPPSNRPPAMPKQQSELKV